MSQTPPRNDVVTRRILAAIAITHPHHLAEKIEAILDDAYRSRQARAASRNGQGAVRTGDKATSIAAALQVNVTRQQKVILKALRGIAKPVTANGIAEAAGLVLGSASTRMKALVTKGLVREVGTELVGNRRKTTYSITPMGRWIGV